MAEEDNEEDNEEESAYTEGPILKNGFCVCPECGHKIARTEGRPCHTDTCPKCKARLTQRKK